MRGLEAEIERDADVLEHGTDRGAKLLLAVAAAMKADADALLGVGLHLRDPAGATAMRARRAIRPNGGFKVSEGGGFIVEVRARQDRHGSNLQCRQPTLGMPCLQAT